PGSSIAWVHREAVESYAAVTAELERTIGAAHQALAGEGDLEVAFNAAPHERSGIPALGAEVVAAPVEPVEVRAEGGGWVLDNGLVSARGEERGLPGGGG